MLKNNMKYLLQLTEAKCSEEIKLLLENNNDKGLIIDYMIELFKGNNYFVEKVHDTSVFKADFALYRKDNYYTRTALVKIIFYEDPISIRDMFSQFGDPFNLPGTYQDTRLYIFSISGYSTLKKYVSHSRKSIHLFDWSDIEFFINRYNNSSNQNYLSNEEFINGYNKLIKALNYLQTNKSKVSRYEFVFDNGYRGCAYNFIKTVQEMYKDKKLPISFIRKLDDIDFIWKNDSKEAKWMYRYISLKENINSKEYTRSDYNWINDQLESYVDGKLTPYQYKKLEDINFFDRFMYLLFE